MSTEHFRPAADEEAGAEPVLVLDLGGQYAQLIARRVRECGVYSELVGHDVPAIEVSRRNPVALILSGGPASVYADDALVDPGLFELGVPTLGICYGAQLMAKDLGGAVERTDVSEFGKTALRVEGGDLFQGFQRSRSAGPPRHRDRSPESARVTAGSPSTPVAAFEAPERGLYGVQFHPEVVHARARPCSRLPLPSRRRRAGLDCGAVIDEQVERIRAQVGDERVLCGLSGGVDSAVAALLVHRAVGDQLTCVFVDHGLLRKDEAIQVVETFGRHFHVPLVHVDAADRFLARLEESPTRRRSGGGSAKSSSASSRRRQGGWATCPSSCKARSTPTSSSPAARPESQREIKSHHNVGGLPDDMAMGSWSRCDSCSRTRRVVSARSSGCPSRWCGGTRSPGRGSPCASSARSRERLETLQKADAILLEVRRAGLYRELWQCFCVLPAIRSVGVQGDEADVRLSIVIRAVTSDDAMTADWARLPYDLLEVVSAASSTRFRRQPGRSRHHLEATRHH